MDTPYSERIASLTPSSAAAPSAHPVRNTLIALGLIAVGCVAVLQASPSRSAVQAHAVQHTSTSSGPTSARPLRATLAPPTAAAAGLHRTQTRGPSNAPRAQSAVSGAVASGTSHSGSPPELLPGPFSTAAQQWHTSTVGLIAAASAVTAAIYWALRGGSRQPRSMTMLAMTPTAEPLVPRSSPAPAKGPYPTGRYDHQAAADYFATRPWLVLGRTAALLQRTSGFGAGVLLDYQSVCACVCVCVCVKGMGGK